MRSYLVLLLIAVSACSQDNISKEQAFVLKTTKEIISNIDLLEPRISDHINNKDVNIKNEIFLRSWISTIKATQNFDNKIVVEIQEHQPVASLNGGRFLTQDGRIITPKDESKELKLISIYGSDGEVGELLSYARLLQNILNLKGDHLTSFKHMGSSFIEAHDNKDTKYSFTKGDFRVQLERLEQLILFELNSGKIDHNRYIDLRYKNAIAVSRKKMEKRI